MYKNNYLIQADEQSQEIRDILLNHDRLSRMEVEKHFKYTHDLSIHEWFNGRERGYALSIDSFSLNLHLHIAFYQHRNCDEVHVLVWEQKAFNPICTIDNADLSETPFWANKLTTYQWFECDRFQDAADFIVETAYDYMGNPEQFIEKLYNLDGARQ